MKEAYCSPEVTKLLEEKGFPKDELNRYEYDPKEITAYKTCTHQKAMSWLREVHNIYLWVQPHQYNYIRDKASKFVFCLYQGDNYDEPCKEDYPAYEDAVEAALKYILKHLIKS